MVDLARIRVHPKVATIALINKCALLARRYLFADVGTSLEHMPARKDKFFPSLGDWYSYPTTIPTHKRTHAQPRDEEYR